MMGFTQVITCPVTFSTGSLCASSSGLARGEGRGGCEAHEAARGAKAWAGWRGGAGRGMRVGECDKRGARGGPAPALPTDLMSAQGRLRSWHTSPPLSDQKATM